MNAPDTDTTTESTDAPAVLTLTIPLPTLAKTIRGRLAEQQKSAAWLAQQLGISPTSVSHRMSGRIPWTLGELSETATNLDLTVGDLVHGSAIHDALTNPITTVSR